ncbi:MAG: hypothetical protein WA274_24665, partial [Candidatus Acidiferrales bacterium]
ILGTLLTPCSPVFQKFCSKRRTRTNLKYRSLVPFSLTLKSRRSRSEKSSRECWNPHSAHENRYAARWFGADSTS